MDERQAAGFRGLVWCPDSNYFLLGQTAEVRELKNKTKIAFGTDSTLTSSWFARDHFNCALKSGHVNEVELFEMLTKNAVDLFGLNDTGSLKEGMKADIVILNKNHQLFEHGPEDIQLTFHKGKIVEADESFEKYIESTRFSRVRIGKKIKLVYGDLTSLLMSIRKIYPEAMIPFSLIE